MASGGRADVRVPNDISQLTPQWLTEVVGARVGGRVDAVRAEPIGTGQVADSYRLHLRWDGTADGPATLVAKTTSAHESSRQAARLTRTYEIEVGFYREVAPTVGVCTPRCWYASFDGDHDGYVVLLEDAAPARQGDQLAGCSPDEAAAALREAALLHGNRWGDPTLRHHSWLNRAPSGPDQDRGGIIAMLIPAFVERYADMAEPATVAMAHRLLQGLGAYMARPDGPTLVHSDFRVDNLLFGTGRVFVLDWQTLGLGPAMADVSYFLGGSLAVEERRLHEERLVREYHQALLAAGGDLPWEACWTGYRRYALDGAVMAFAASALVERTERGDQMFVTMADRAVQHALDLDTWDLVG